MTQEEIKILQDIVGKVKPPTLKALVLIPENGRVNIYEVSSHRIPELKTVIGLFEMIDTKG